MHEGNDITDCSSKLIHSNIFLLLLKSHYIFISYGNVHLGAGKKLYCKEGFLTPKLPPLVYDICHCLAAFQEADKNKDGFLSMEEYVKVFR